MSDDYINTAFTAIPQEMRQDCWMEIPKRMTSPPREPLQPLPIAERDQSSGYPRDDQDTPIERLSATAFLWAPDIKVDGQRWTHLWDPV